MYYIVYGIFYLMSLLPMWILYILSDILAVLVFVVLGYRRKVIMENISIAFPEKSMAERKKIARKFYHNFVDNFIETLKLLSASPAWINKRFRLDSDPFKKFYADGRKVQLHLGHNFNWELANAFMPMHTEYEFLVVYMPIKNKAIDRLFMKLRTRTGSVMLPATNMRNSIVQYRHSQYMLALVADQAPGSPERAFWLNFFGRPTPFVKGPESGARAGNIPVVFADIYKTSRGRYRVRLEIGAENPKELPEGELTRRYIRFLEESIRKHPEMWLWSHRRWKHDWKEEYRKLWIDTDPVK
ncbi:lysophospholipid acyltransferase family protein [Pseudoflavitalea rhizosphaerae]|uniref:lysophospholipid acyltransferase family protein n=1 Tax=Pseudoflavitalea rhizosphaerae TaxID=1884793 RepID=UPI000F8EE5A6|nr:lysophospholipid acyltransferase family protein [Pseudoflavitalea rhizosphaerae]